MNNLSNDIANQDNKEQNDKSNEEEIATECSSTEINEDVKNPGKLILDATCTSADIHYPTDLWLLNTAREALEEIIDIFH